MLSNARVVARVQQKIVMVGLLSCTLTVLGCSGSDGTYPVKGEVFVNDQPAAGAEITFYEVNPDKEHPHFPTAIVGPDGSFELTTFTAKDGAPPGEYKVAIVWRQSWRDEGETHYGPDTFNNQYNVGLASPLPSVTVKAEKNVVPRIDLKVYR